MKKLFNWVIGIPFLCMVLITTTGSKAVAQDVSVSFQSFYDNLAPYGQWINDPQYGNVFVPYEDPGFRPYTRGHWVMTEYGNTWVSDDPWGWACYHYGRWTYNGYYGWIWIPGYEWAPAWVSWRCGRGYCGWAPLGPGIYGGDGYSCPVSWWTFIEPRYMYEPRWHDYHHGYEDNERYYRRTEYMNNYDEHGQYGRYNYGPRPEYMERETHQHVEVYHTVNAHDAGSSRVEGHTVSIYHPTVDRNSVNNARPANVIAAPHPIEAKGQEAPRRVEQAPAPAFRQEHPMPAQGNIHQAQPPVHNNQPEPPARNNPNEAQQPGHIQQPEPNRNNQHESQPPVHNQQQEPGRNNMNEAQPPVHNQQPEPMRNNQQQPPMHNQQQEPPRNAQPPMHNNQQQGHPQPNRQPQPSQHRPSGKEKK